jgi:hypothetical protein
MSSLERLPARQVRPRFGRMGAAVAYSGIGKSRLYEWAQANPTLIRKNGAASLIDFDVLDGLLDSLPTMKAE